MGGRYLITGTQIGILTTITKDEETKKILKKIMEEQFLYDSEQELQTDIKKIMREST